MVYYPTGFFILGVIVLGLGYDLFVMVKKGPNFTISAWVYNMSQSWPIIPFLAGIAAGHFWFSVRC